MATFCSFSSLFLSNVYNSMIVWMKILLKYYTYILIYVLDPLLLFSENVDKKRALWANLQRMFA